MNNDKLTTLANSLMKQHGLSDWKFVYDNAKTRLGCCKYRTKTISFSIHFALKLDESEAQDTILHEIAHALVGSEHGHDAVWAKKCREIGCRDQRCYTGEVRVEGKYSAVCPKCGRVHYRHKRSTRKSSCNCTGNFFNTESLLVFKQNW